MTTTISHGEGNSGFQAGVIHGNIENITIVQSETLDQACLRDLRTTNPADDKERIKNAKGGLLKDSYSWILDNREFRQWQDSQRNRLLWIRGDPGKGKTMLLCGIIEELTRLYGDNSSISFFFCQATDVRINNATAVLRGLIYSLIEMQPSLLSHVRSQYDLAGKILFEDINAWNALSKILNNILKDPNLSHTYLVIDALDECTTDLHVLLDFVVQESTAHPHVKWIVSSRNWPDIEERLNIATQVAPISLELNEEAVSDAVRRFIRHKVVQLARVKKYSDEIRDTVYHYLLANSQGTFLWVALVCQELNRTSRRHAIKKLQQFPPGLDTLYGRMVDQIRRSEDAELCKRMLAVMSIVYRPITLEELTTLVEMPHELFDDYGTRSEIIAVCGSFLALREDTISFVHQSAKDFLLREARNEIFPGGKETEHYAIFSRSLQFLLQTLHHDIYGLKDPGFPIEHVRPPSPDPLLKARYSCFYWVDHLIEGGTGRNHEEVIQKYEIADKFISKAFLHWLEALSLLNGVSLGIASIMKLENSFQLEKDSSLANKIRDASRFMRYYKRAIEDTPLQVYSSALIFSPVNSIIKRLFLKEKPDWVTVQTAIPDDWSPCLQTLEGHKEPIGSVCWSNDGTWLASGSEEGVIKLWNPSTGQCVLTIQGHELVVSSVAWSPDGTKIASAAESLKIWDRNSGKRLAELHTSIRTNLMSEHSHWYYVESIAWSHDGTEISSISNEGAVQVWDLASTQCISWFDCQLALTGVVAWSNNGKRLASTWHEDYIRIWDLATGRVLSTLVGHCSRITSIAWSQDGKYLASGAEDKTIKTWDLATDLFLLTLAGHDKQVTSVTWLSHDQLLASGSADRSIRIWSSATGHCLSTFEGHTDDVTSIAWSEDMDRLASGSSDHTVKTWIPAISHDKSIIIGHNDEISFISWSYDGKLLASGSLDMTIKVWDPATGHCTLTLSGHRDSVSCIAWSNDGEKLASGSWDQTIKIWNTATAKCLWTFKSPQQPVIAVAWSHDGMCLASASAYRDINIWNLASGKQMSTDGTSFRSSEHTSLAWSHDGTRIAAAHVYGGASIDIWNVADLECEFTFEENADWMPQISVNWSLDGARLTSILGCTITNTWDLVTRRRIYSNSYQGYGIDDDHESITLGGKKVLWLPPEFRPTWPKLPAAYGDNLAIGCDSYRILILKFSKKPSH